MSDKTEETKIELPEIKFMMGIQCDTERIDELQRDVSRKFGVSRPNLAPHITMLPPIKAFEGSPKILSRIQALSQFTVREKPFELVVEGFDHFFGNVVILDLYASGEFKEFSDRFNKAMIAEGISLGRFEINRHPHITVVKEFKKTVDHQAILDYVNEYHADLIGQKIPIKSISLYSKETEWDMRDEMVFSG